MTTPKHAAGPVRGDCEWVAAAACFCTYAPPFLTLRGVLRASLRMHYERGGYQHDLLLLERFSDAQLDRLASLGFDASVRLEVWSELLEAPTPLVQDALVSAVPANPMETYEETAIMDEYGSGSVELRTKLRMGTALDARRR